MTTANERLTAWAKTLSTTPENIQRHTANTMKAHQAAWTAKQHGATDAELIALATAGTSQGRG